ncbi:atypical chemokine receptor 1 [Sarcophilus harrisii]|uniref:Atypical chemokine receptor 1 n=1 Tax=Sarcophilus harrisii TaxID=9305 RepID=A0A7N4UY62_SARHA|nr:atypical chemokine receptor 1 [Sarcophilus harrisii]
MGNCLHRAGSKLQISENLTINGLEEEWDALWNDTYNYTDADLDLAAPCRSCLLLDSSSLPFFALTSALGILAGGALLFVLLKPLVCQHLCPGRAILAQVAGGSTLFSIVLPILAPGLNPTPDIILCSVGHGLWYASAFAQALLLCVHIWLGPKLPQRWLLKLSLTLWGLALLMALPVALASDVTTGVCTLSFSPDVWVWCVIHIVVCIAIFFILPLSLVGAWVVQRIRGGRSGPWAKVLWVWFLFWWLHAVVMGSDILVRSDALVIKTCFVQQTLDFLLDSAKILGILHCLVTPLLLALFCHYVTWPPTVNPL